jgi:hypothetical protein
MTGTPASCGIGMAEVIASARKRCVVTKGIAIGAAINSRSLLPCVSDCAAGPAPLNITGSLRKPAALENSVKAT